MLLGSPAAIAQTPETPRAKVYYTSEISPEGLQKVYDALGVKPEEHVAVKISTGESEQSHQLDPQLIAPFIQRINRQHGTHIVDYAQKIGFGTKGYELIDITATPADAPLQGAIERYNVYDMNGNMVLANADTLKTLKPGQYIVNGRPFTVK